MVLISIFLLYLTLRDQQKQGVQHIKEQLETTFFKLLHYHRELTDKVYKTYTTINEDFKLIAYRIHGRQYFEFAINTIKLIQQSLSGTEYKGTLDLSEVNSQLAAIEAGESSQHRDDFLQECRIKQCNEEYLPLSKWKELHKEEDKELVAYKAFCDKHHDTYDTYIRRIKQLLRYLIEHQKLNAKEYAKYIQMQMTRSELKFLNLHSNIDKELKALLEETLLTQIEEV